MTKLSLIALSVLYAAKATPEGATTVKIDLAIVGKWEGHANGAFEISAEDLQTIKSNFDSSDIDIVIDYEHMTLWGDKAPAAGWIKSVEIEGNKLVAVVEWVESAKEAILKGEYRYISPVLDPHTIDQVTGEDIGWSLHSAALTNKPFLEELGDIKAAKNQPQKQEENSMTPEEQSRLDKAEKTAKRVKTVEDENTSLKEANDALRANSATATVDGAIAAKKISPDQKDWALKYCKDDAEGFADFLKNAKSQTQVPPNDQFEANNTHRTTTIIPMSKV